MLGSVAKLPGTINNRCLKSEPFKTSRADGQTVLACIYRVTIMQQHSPYRVFICASILVVGKNMSMHFFRPG